MPVSHRVFVYMSFLSLQHHWCDVGSDVVSLRRGWQEVRPSRHWIVRARSRYKLCTFKWDFENNFFWSVWSPFTSPAICWAYTYSRFVSFKPNYKSLSFQMKRSKVISWLALLCGILLHCLFNFISLSSLLWKWFIGLSWRCCRNFVSLVTWVSPVMDSSLNKCLAMLPVTLDSWCAFVMLDGMTHEQSVFKALLIFT